MQELQEIEAAVKPTEILLVVDAMTGQDAVNVAENFDKQLSLTGVILTKLDETPAAACFRSVQSHKTDQIHRNRRKTGSAGSVLSRAHGRTSWVWAM